MKDTWTTVTQPTLRRIREFSQQASTRAQWIKTEVMDLPAKPTFVTLAEADLEDAIRDVTEALKLMRKARDLYARKPVETMQAAE